MNLFRPDGSCDCNSNELAGGACPAIASIRDTISPEGKAAWMERYGAHVRARPAQLAAEWAERKRMEEADQHAADFRGGR